MKYIIFGGEGFIGQHLIQYLVEGKGISVEDVISCDLERKSEYPNYIFTDVRKAIDLRLPELGNAVIFNLAAVHKTPGHPDHEYFETNIQGAEHVCAFAENNQINTIVFTSSIAPYGASEDHKSEETLPMPNTPYGISKLVAEHIFNTWRARNENVRKLAVVRPGVVFGKGEGGNFTRLYEAQSRGFFFFPGRKTTLKASVYVKDVVRILHDLAVSDLPDNYALYNLTFYPAPAIDTICSTIADITKVSRPSIVIPGWILKIAAQTLFSFGMLVGKKINGIHPDRVKKLMISTNINGSKLNSSRFQLRYTLKSAIRDWVDECGGHSLY